MTAEIINPKHEIKVAAHGLNGWKDGDKTIRCFPFERKRLADFARDTRKAHARRTDWPRYTLRDLRKEAAKRYA